MKLFIVLLLLFYPLFSDAQEITGNNLNEWIAGDERANLSNPKTTDYMSSSLLQGYVRGVLDSTSGLTCIPSGVTLGQSMAVVKKYLRDHPENWNWKASWIVSVAIMEAFPCPKK